jgi:hypothetical protein
MNPGNYIIPMLELYCTWLNKWMESEGNDHRYDILQFTINDPEHHLYGSTTLLAVIPNTDGSSAFPRFMTVCRTTDGDEGGPTDLTAWWEINEDNTTEIVAMVQGFDTNLQFIYEDRKFDKLP